MPRTFLRVFLQPLSVLLPLFLIAVLSAGTAAAEEDRSGVFNPETFTLENGLRVLVVTNTRAPVVLHMIWYPAGAADEPPGHSGVAHFLEHLMFKATRTLESGEFSRIVARNGGRENAFTSWDYTGYFQFVAKDRLPIMMRIEADRMVNLVLSESDIASEREVILEERRTRIENNPHSILSEAARASLFRNHPYGVPVIGWQHEMAELSREDAIAFYRRYYAPNNAILLLVGDITADEARPMVEETYGKIARRDIEPNMRPQEPPQRAERRVIYRDGRAENTFVLREYAAPSYVNGESRHAYALEILADVLGSGSSSRLYRNLVVEQGIAVSAGARYNGSRRGPGTLTFQITPKPDVEPPQVEAALQALIDDLLRNGISDEELANAKNRLLADAIYARDSHRQAASALGAALAIGQTVEDVEAWPQRIEAVTAEQVAEAARYVLQPSRSVTAILYPEEESVEPAAGQQQ